VRSIVNEDTNKETGVYRTTIMIEVLSEHERLPEWEIQDIIHDAIEGSSSMRTSVLEHAKINMYMLKKLCAEHGTDVSFFTMNEEDNDE